MANKLWSSKRLVYRGTSESDAAFLLECETDETAYENMSFFIPKPRSVEDGKNVQKWLDSTLMHALICLRPAEGEKPSEGKDGKPDEAGKEKGKPIGYIALMLGGDPKTTFHHRRAEIGICLHPSYHGQGYGSEAIQWALEWGFMRAGMAKIEIGTFEWNTGARRLYERLGFTLEGRKRKHLWHMGRFWDLFDYGMLEDEWRERYGAKALEQKAVDM